MRKKDQQDVLVTKAMCGADCWTDHRLIISKLKLHIQPRRRPQGQKTAKRLNVSKLKSKEIAEDFARDLDKRLLDSPDMTDIEEKWANFRDTVYSSALEHLGPSPRKQQD
ncbi:hypothetical protein GJAV_G00168550 [Gymnothorax javanicus]|nr:hypothetical protein GJAV_G00168550 [Gymnothorax javanicus]